MRGDARHAGHGPRERRRDLVGGVDAGAELAGAGAQVVAEPADDKRDTARVGQRRLQLVDGHVPVGAALQGVHVLRHVEGGADLAGDGLLRRVDELAGAGDQAHGAQQAVEGVDRAMDLEGELGDAVAERGQRHALEDDVGDAAVGRRVAGAFLGFDEAVGELVLAAGVEAIGDGGKIELLAVGPHAAEAGDRAFGEGDGEVGEIAVLDAGRGLRLRAAALAAAAAAAGLDDLLLEVGGPDDLAAEARVAVEARDGRAFGGGGDAQVGEAGPVRQGRVAGGAEQGLVDEGAGKRAELGAQRGAGDGGAEDVRPAGRSALPTAAPATARARVAMGGEVVSGEG